MKRQPLKTLIRKLDRIFSEYIRLRDADSNGFIHCCTCGKIVYWKRSDCGHYNNRRHLYTRWDEQNCSAQCRNCNRFEEGNKDRFKEYLLKKYGQQVVDLLAVRRTIFRKYHRFELELMIKCYTEKVKEMKKTVA